MSIFKRALIELSRHRFKTIILFVVFCLTFTGVLSSLVLIYSSNHSKSTILSQIGATITLDYADTSAGDELIFTENIIAHILAVEHVIGSNQHYSDYALPTNFSNCKLYDGEDPSQQEVLMELDAEVSDYVVIEGDSSIAMIDLFRSGNAVLSCGNYPSAQQQGILISQQLADENNVWVGDTLSFSAYGKEIIATITGIYQTKAIFSITKDNIVGTAVYAYSPYNRIYSDLETATEFFNIDTETLYVDVYVDDPNNVQDTGLAIKALDFDWSKYSLINTTQTNYKIQANQIEATAYVANLLLLFISFISFISIILVTSIWAERFRYESGIYLALGSSKWHSILQQFIASLYLATPALIISLICSKPLANLLLVLKERIAEYNTGSFSQYTTGLENSISVNIVAPDVSTYTVFSGCILATVILAILLPAYCVFRLKPKEILTKK